jgi:uncharacterized protein
LRVDLPATERSDEVPPVQERLIALDFVRGVAVLGILLLNIVGFSWPEIVYVSPRAPTGPTGLTEDWTYLASFVLADGKFRGLFSLLFGASLLLFVERADAAGHDGAALQARRLGWLAVFGLVHFFLLWWGDILFLYAMCGFPALAMRDWAPRRLVRWALGIYAAGVLVMGALTAVPAATWLGFPGAHDAHAIERAYGAEAREEMAITRGPWAGRVGRALSEQVADPLVTVAISWFETLPLMMLGMALFKCGFFAGTWPAGQLRRWAVRGIAGGLILTLPIAGWMWAERFPLALTLFLWLSPAALGRLAMVVGYAALMVLAARRFAGTTAGQRLVACGRMAFSNYLGTSLLMTFLFHGWGLGLYARYGRFELLGFVLLGWAVMLAWSKPWLARFRQGPLEWLWRSLTYFGLEPMRR